MLNRIFILILAIISVFWITFVGFDILSAKNSYQPEKLFGKDDGELIIFNHPKEIKYNSLENYTSIYEHELIASLSDSLFKTGYFSGKRSHFLLIGIDNWTPAMIKQLLSTSGVSISFDGNSIRFNEYKGRYHKDRLYIFKENILPVNSYVSNFKFDKNASVSIIRFAENESINSVSDIYFTKEDKIDFVTHYQNTIQGKQIKDEILFSNLISKNINSYHFKERDYYASIDSVFIQSPMFRWTLNGFIEIDYQGEKAIISDYIDGQDPILQLNDISRTTDTSVFSIPLTSTFPQKGKSYKIKYLEDVVVISENPTVCDKLIADFKLGQTIALNEEIRNRFYGSLPKSVSERHITKDRAYSKAVYKEYVLETRIGNVSTHSVEPQHIAQNLSIGTNFDPLDFVLGRKHTFFVLGSQGGLKCFKGEKELWSRDLNGKPIGGIELIDLYANGEEYVLVNTRDEIHLFNIDGKYATGFPIRLDSRATNQVKFYRWKEKSYFLVADENKKVYHFNAKGNELNIYKTQFPISRKIDVWSSQGMLFASFTNESSFVMFDLEKGKVFREFTIPSNSFPAKTKNELIHFTLDNNNLVKLDQKGVRTVFDNYPKPKILSVHTDNHNPVIILQSANELRLINGEGIPFGKIVLPFNEISYVSINNDVSGSTVIAVIDGLENNVYLYNLKGKLLSKNQLEGETKVQISSFDNKTIITTIVDQFIVQYLTN